MSKVPKYVMIVDDGCGACEAAKQKLAAPISSGDVKILNARTEAGYKAIKGTSEGGLYVPKILQVIDMGESVELCSIEDDKPRKCITINRSELGV